MKKVKIAFPSGVTEVWRSPRPPESNDSKRSSLARLFAKKRSRAVSFFPHTFAKSLLSGRGGSISEVAHLEARSAYSEARSAYSETRSAYSEARSAYSEAHSAYSETRPRTLKSEDPQPSPAQRSQRAARGQPEGSQKR